jgi:NAD+--asparagine ADP-ribosyltransferase
VYQEAEAYGEQNDTYFRFDLKFSYIRNLKKVTQKWYVRFAESYKQGKYLYQNAEPKNRCR